MSSIDQLMHEMGITGADLERRRRHVGLAERDLEVIRRLKGALQPRVGELVDLFFKHLTEFDEARPLLGQRERLERARQLKRDHLETMFEADFGLPYVRQRVELGLIYSRAALPTRVFLGAYEHLLGRMSELADSPDAFASLRKAVFFDIALMVDVLVAERERIIREQQDAIRELSTPVLKLRDRLLLVPVIGLVDSARARLFTHSMLAAIAETRARVVVIDVTGVAHVDTRVAHHLFQTASAARLMGVRVIVSGLSVEVSQSLSMLGVDTRALETVSDLQGALEDAEKLLAERADPPPIGPLPSATGA